MTIESEPNQSESNYYPETQNIIDSLRINPKQRLNCSHGGEAAIGLFEVPGGCVALPGLETQLLCPQHIITNGSFEGMTLIVDLSINGRWSAYNHDRPDYVMVEDGDSGEISMLALADSPFADELSS